MSKMHTVEVRCDHCGFEAKMEAGDQTAGWLTVGGYLALDVPEFDLCPNCLSDLKEWLRAGPQHAEERERIKREVSVRSGRYAERLALSRHPASNSKLGINVPQHVRELFDD